MDTIDLSFLGRFFILKTFIKVFIVSFLFFIVAYYLGGFSYIKDQGLSVKDNYDFGFYQAENIPDIILSKIKTEAKEDKTFTSLEEAKELSSRVNFLIVGMEDVRTDTIIFASFNKDTKNIDMISIPRDTYVHRKGHNRGEERKINSVYNDHGIEGVKRTVSYILGDIPIHHHIILDYKGVRNIIDLVGGVEVDIPRNMKYEDHTADPPVYIDLKKGRQVLDGKKALDFIRWRKDNRNKGYIDGDLGRVKAQQQIIKSLAAKVKDNLVNIIISGFKHVKTDVNLLDAIGYGRDAIGIDEDNMHFSTLPGEAESRIYNRKLFSYFIYNKSEVMKLVEEIYNVVNN